MHKFPHRLLIRPQKWKKKEKKYLQYAHRIIVLSDHFKNQLAERYPSLDKSKFVVFPNIPNLSKLLSYPIDMQILKDKKHDDDFVLFYFGLISKRRGLNVVFDAIQQLVKSNPSLKLLLVGPIDKNERADFMVRINSEELKKHILYYEWMDISHLPSLISVSDLCLSPIEKNEHHESGVANKVYQYMVFGKALLVSDCKPQADLVASSGAGMVHKWDDSKDLAQKIEAVYSDKDQLIGMGVNARRSIFKLIKDSPYAKDLLAIYEPKN
jgi:glycosyltransferase involved in cell wall biosynthesis